MSDLSHLKAGDPVRVFEENRSGQPGGGWEGRVESVGRKYLVIAFFRNGGPEHEIRVQISDGRSPDQYRRFTVKTPEVAERDLARSEDRRMLLRAGLSFTSSGFQELMDDELLHKLAEMVEPYVLTTVAERIRRTS